MTNIQTIERKIEKLRMQMYECYKDNRFSSDVVEISQELDKLLNEVQNIPSTSQNT
ncbi:aspartyl-phosphate phosphatase Spo0E family protein [Aquibacillus kalidii]|uniref:aspartyl-phosphate phosphatase Spo0E family protein n=1 Tax=Aquibacillus kalidii TaxID=2762597 RepID=UPI001646D25F|nr:aspartyl-phosphate phosphatase Spo0E family protein [Aquibacillus kalidii]